MVFIKDAPPPLPEISYLSKRDNLRNAPVVLWLELHASTAGGTGSIPGQGTKILHAAQHSQKKRDNSFISQIFIEFLPCDEECWKLEYNTLEHNMRTPDLRTLVREK